MKDALSIQPPLDTPVDYRAAIDQCLSEMDQIKQRMDKDQIVIDQLKAETRAIIQDMRAA